MISSTWVAKEINHALWGQEKRTDGYKVIPILLGGVEPSALRLWFGKKEPLPVQIGNGHDAVTNALPELLAALGERLPSGKEAAAEKKAASKDKAHPDGVSPPSANLTLELDDLPL